MSIAAGARLGPYEIVSALGAGGMGEVWRARDTKLGREVALKILPDAFALDPDRLARFKREAQILASLNHPNIAAIHGFEESAGIHALVLELVEGPTLADRIAEGPIPLDDALPIARQIAEALEGAHEQSIIHRDLKPSNIKLRPDGSVKVLDFGLAKVTEPTAAIVASGLSMSPTITSPAATHFGLILGTAAYMAPEQARGKTLDKRVDIWAFGCVLYEMLTGKRAFEEEDVSLTLSKILQREPDFDALPRDVPARVCQALAVCLRKDPRQRIADIRDVRLAMEGVFETTALRASDVAAVAALPVSWRRATPWLGGVMLGGMIAGLGVRALIPQPVRPVTRFVADAAPNEFFSPRGVQRGLAISPDGTRIVYRAQNGYFHVRAMNQLEGMSLVPTVTPVDNPFFAPDGSWVGFATDGTWKKVSVLGGQTTTLWKVGERGGPRGASWGEDGTVIFTGSVEGTGLFRGPAAGGEPEVLTTPDAERGESAHWWPEILPGDRAVLFTILKGGLTAEDTDIAVLDLTTGERRTLISGGTNPQYAPSGHIVYGLAGALRAVPFDLDRLEVTGDPVPVLEGVMTHPSGAVEFDISENGSLIYVAGGVAETASRTLVWVDRGGREEPIAAPPRAYTSPHLSPDGTRAAFDVRDREQDSWIWDFGRQNSTRLTLDAARERAPIWMDDRRVVFESERDGRLRLYSQSADGTGVPERIGDAEHQQGFFQPKSVSPDGKWLVVTYPSPPTRNIGLIDLTGDRRLKPLIEPGFIKDQPAVSPDGRWIAYHSNETGRNEIYVRPFPAIDRRWTISANGGERPVWSRDSRELFFIEPPGRLMAVSIEPGADFSAGRPQLLFEGQFAAAGGRWYDVAADGRFLMMKTVSEPEPSTARLIVVENWLDELKRLVPKD